MDINVQLISYLLYEMSLSTIFMKNFLNIISTEPLLKQIECLYQYKLTAEFLFYSLMFCLKVWSLGIYDKPMHLRILRK